MKTNLLSSSSIAKLYASIVFVLFANYSFGQVNLKLDSTFAGTGIYMNVVNDNYISSTGASAVQADGKIITAGFLTNYLTAVIDSFAVFRFNNDGTLDNAFGANGMAIVTVPSAVAYNNNVMDVKVQPDGKILLLGFFATSTGNATIIARFDSSGVLDPSFGLNGTVVHSIFPYEAYSSIGLQSNGKILITGFMAYDALPRSVMARFNVDGSPDSLFDPLYGGDKIIDSLGLNFGTLSYNMKIGSDDKILIDYCSEVSQFGNGNVGLLKFNSDGSYDTSFGVNGRTTTLPFIGYNPVSIFSLQSNGNVVASQADVDSVYFRVFDVNGLASPTFNGTGYASVYYPDINGNSRATILPLSNNNFVYSNAQFDSTVNTINYSSQVLLGMNANGTVMTTLGTSGFLRTGLGVDGLLGTGSVQPDGKLIFPAFSGNSRGYCIRYMDASSTSTGLTVVDGFNYSLSLFPNPTSNNLNVFISSPVNDEVVLTICDISGKIVNKQVVNSNEQIFIDDLSIEKGVYIVNAVYSDGKMVATKLIVQ